MSFAYRYLPPAPRTEEGWCSRCAKRSGDGRVTVIVSSDEDYECGSCGSISFAEPCTEEECADRELTLRVERSLETAAKELARGERDRGILRARLTARAVELVTVEGEAEDFDAGYAMAQREMDAEDAAQ